MNQTTWNAEQLLFLDAAGIPDGLRVWYGMSGYAPDDVSMSIWHSLRSTYWPELTHTPAAYEMRIWRLPDPVPYGKLNNETVYAHPSMLGLAPSRPEGDPEIVITIDANTDNRAMGAQLGAEVWRWLRTEPRTAAFYAEEIALHQASLTAPIDADTIPSEETP